MKIAVAGGGPVGLISALLLCKQGVKVTVFEQASRKKHFMDQGSGFTLSPASCYILDKLGIYQKLRETTKGYKTLQLCTSEGMVLSREDITTKGKSDLGEFDMIPLSRSLFQNFITRELTEYQENGIFTLNTSCSVFDFNDRQDGKVEVIFHDKLNEDKVKSEEFDALLGCDGVYSKVRHALLRKLNIEDNLNYTGITAWWNKFHYKEALKSEEPQRKQFAEMILEHFKKPMLSQIMLPTSKLPLSFFATQINESLTDKEDTTMSIVVFAAKKEPYIADKDLTKRGGSTGKNAKDEILKLMFDESGMANVNEKTRKESIVYQAMEIMSEDDFVMTGMYDRNNSKIPFASGRVCILGDAAHPQTPFLGQGLNMGVTDAYVISLHLGNVLKSGVKIEEAFQAYDNAERKRSGQDVVDGARIRAKVGQNTNSVLCWIRDQLIRWVGGRSLVESLVAKDKTNTDAILTAEKQMLMR